ncbi:hypothetical protein [Saccharopolyspora sp. 5N708]|uniref:hypothetical protein n=1 Tax=Saccharopolyspora sp. 5N708 TaxID=3457424 RepID=UPI003FCFAC5A
MPDESISHITWQGKFDREGNPLATEPKAEKVGSNHFAIEVEWHHKKEEHNKVTYEGIANNCFVDEYFGYCEAEAEIAVTARLTKDNEVVYSEEVTTTNHGWFNTWGGYYEDRVGG